MSRRHDGVRRFDSRVIQAPKTHDVTGTRRSAAATSRAASGRAWNWLMSRRRLDGEFELIRLLLTEEGTEGVSPCRVCVPRVVRPTRAVWRLELSAVDSVWIVVAGDLWSRYYGPMLAQYHVHITR